MARRVPFVATAVALVAVCACQDDWRVARLAPAQERERPSYPDCPLPPGENAHLKACSGDGWCLVHPIPQSGAVTDLWAYSADHAWAVGTPSLAMRWGGTSWEPMPSPAFAVAAVWGHAPDQVRAIETWGQIFRWDGAAWAREHDCDGCVLHALWGSGPDDIWALGREVALHFDGAAWQRVEVPPGLELRDVWGDAPGRYWAAGFSGDVERGAVLRLQGDTWVQEPLGESPPLFCVTGSGERDVWAGGGESDAGLLWRWDGDTWTRVEVPDSRRLWGMVARAPGELWLSGATQLLRFDGAQFHPEHPGAYQAHATAATDGALFFAGAGLLQLRGACWQRADWQQVAWQDMAGIWGSSPDNVLIAAEDGFVRWDGARWSRDFVAGWEMLDVHGRAADDAWAVGRNFDNSGVGAAAHWDGHRWTPASPDVADVLTGVWVAADGQAFASSAMGRVLRWDGARWTVIGPAFEVLSCADVWGTSPQHLFVTCHDPPLLEWDGQIWRRADIAETERMGELWGVSPDEVWSNSAGGRLWRWRSAEGWQQQPAPAGYSIRGLASLGAQQRWLLAMRSGDLDGAQVALRWDGSGWVEEALPLFGPWALSIAAVPPDRILVGANSGVVLERRVRGEETP